jgi:hypothetical protein
MSTGVQLPDAATVCVVLEPAPLAERIAAARELLYALDAAPDVDASGAFEDARVVVSVPFGLSATWRVDFHLVWPEPQLNNQHLSALKLVARAAWGGTSVTAAGTVRATAEARLRTLIGELTAPGAALAGRIRLIGD